MELGVYEKAICRKIASTFEIAANEGYHPTAFANVWLRSDTMQLLVDINLNEIAQSPWYILNSLKMEMQDKGIKLQTDVANKEFADIMYWGGYFIMYMAYQEQLSGQDIEAAYNIEEILRCYDTLHTVSLPVAIDKAKKNFFRVAPKASTVLHHSSAHGNRCQ